MTAAGQLQFPDHTWPCNTCQSTGRETDPETAQERRCRVCGGAGTLEYDPTDRSVIPF